MKNLLAVFLLVASAFGQNWSGILAPARAIDWSHAGATIVNRSTPCATQPTLGGVAATNATQMSTAIAAAMNGNCVIGPLPAGVYHFPGSINIISNSNTVLKGNFTIRGNGANSTFFIFDAFGAAGAAFYMSNNDTNYSGGPSNVADWTGGYAQGATTITLNNITLGAITHLHTGSLIILDQLDNTSDPGNIIVMQDTGVNSSHVTEGGSGIGRPGISNCDSTNVANKCRSQMQQVTVVSCVGANAAACDSGTATAPYTVVITPGLYAPNWNGGQSPGAWWSNGVPLTGVGIENLSIDAGSNNGTAEFYWTNVTNSWVKGVRGVSTNVYAHAKVYQSSHNTFEDSYWYGSQGASNSYGLDPSYGSCDNLFQNNIAQHIATAWILEGGCGNVFGYNYAVDNYYTPGGNWQQGDIYSHGPNHMNLFEGMEGIEAELDDIHDPNFMETTYRSYLSGFDPGGGNAKTTQILTMQLNAWSRYHHIVGNVLGSSGFLRYSQEASSTTDCGSISNGDHSIFALGYSGNTGSMFTPLAGTPPPTICPSGRGAAFSIFDDPLVASTLMRWGNYDTVNAVVRFVAGEKGNGAVTYPALASPSTTLPSSFYLSGQPAFWNTAVPFPPIGPDVTGGNITGVGGHAYHNPAGNCYLNVMGGVVNGSSGPLAFDPTLCYYISAPTWAVTASKSGTGAGTLTSSDSVINCGATCSDPSVPDGTVLTISQSATGGSSFINWGGTCGCTGSGACAPTITAACSVTAVFNLNGGNTSAVTVTPGIKFTSGVILP